MRKERNELLGGRRSVANLFQYDLYHSRLSNWKKCLSLLYLLVLFSILNPTPLFAETYVSGEITSNTTWTLAGSPYIVTGDVTVRRSGYSYHDQQYAALLTIEPGVVEIGRAHV